jgi:hypothetical protein
VHAHHRHSAHPLATTVKQAPSQARSSGDADESAARASARTERRPAVYGYVGGGALGADDDRRMRPNVPRRVSGLRPGGRIRHAC